MLCKQDRKILFDLVLYPIKLLQYGENFLEFSVKDVNFKKI
jgi:hypothetical protein